MVEEVLKLELAQKVVSVADLILSLEKKNQPVIAILVMYSWPLTDSLPFSESESFSLSLYFVFSLPSGWSRADSTGCGGGGGRRRR